MKKITVLMTTYNEKIEILKKAIESILNQTFTDFDFLIIVDNPKNKEIIDCLNSYKAKDGRIKFLVNENNLGLPLALNRGIDEIETKYLARMDADDISMPERLEKQYKFMEENQKLSLLGANVIYMDFKGDLLFKRGRLALTDKQIREAMKYENMFNHPTFFGKTEIFKKYRYRNFKYSQDYDLTCRLLENGELLANMPDYLLKYRRAENTKTDKIIKQKIIKDFIQTHYREGDLSTSFLDENQVNEESKSVDREKFMGELSKYNGYLSLARSKNYLRGGFGMFFFSLAAKYYKNDARNLFKYARTKKKLGF